MTREEWLSCIRDVTRKISSQKYQDDSWFGKTDIISSPDELICELFDDYLFDDFINSELISLSENQINHAIIFKDDLNFFLESIDDDYSAHDIFNDPRWERVRKSARQFLKSLTEYDNKG